MLIYLAFEAVIQLLVICGMVAVLLVLYSLAVTRAPFIPVPSDKVDQIIAAMHLAPGSVLYDLGSGDGRILLAAAKAQPTGKYIGIDSAVAAQVALFRIWRAKASAISIRRKNFFTVHMSDATHVYC
jgi:tRNA G46 methylase TrmB